MDSFLKLLIGGVLGLFCGYIFGYGMGSLNRTDYLSDDITAIKHQLDEIQHTVNQNQKAIFHR